MTFKLPPLPYALDALEPHISAATLHEHHGKHQRAYLKKVDEFVHSTPQEHWPLERLLREAHGPLRDQAAQAWNHEFYFLGLSPEPASKPTERLTQAITASFGNLASLRRQFSEAASAHFGSGWAWLCCDAQGRLSVHALHDAGNPLQQDLRPLLACDVWEHAYYLDHKHDRAAYVKAFWRVVDWDFVGRQYAADRPYASRTSTATPLRAAS
jgi:Fe-Mn family superoxide dismutase